MSQYRISVSKTLDPILKKLEKQKPDLHLALSKQLLKIVREPLLGKPLKNVMRGYLRMHVGSYVIVYEIVGDEVRLTDFDHHDKIYKKYG